MQCSCLDPNLLDNIFLGDSQTDFTIFHQNIRSLGANFHKFDEIFQNCSVLPDIFAFTETKLDEDKSIPEIKGYKFESLDSVTSCGGVGMYISEQLNYTLRPDLSLKSKQSEDLSIDISAKSNKSAKGDGKLVVGVIYRHPRQNYSVFCDKLCNTLHLLNKTQSKYVIVGDIIM